MAKKQSNRTTARARITADEGEKALRRMRKAPPVFTQEEMYKLEAKIKEDGDGVTRRIALAVLAEPGAKFLEDIAGKRDYAVAIANTSECLVGYVGRLRQLTELMEATQLRMVIALANRTDMDSVIREAKAPSSAEVRP